jgi:hypothetical protein
VPDDRVEGDLLPPALVRRSASSVSRSWSTSPSIAPVNPV